MQRTSISLHYLKVVILLSCCSGCALLDSASTGSADAEMRSSAVQVISKSSCFQMSFPCTWKAIYKDINPACELYMTDGTAFCYIEALPKQGDMESILNSIKKVPIVEYNRKAKKQGVSPESVWCKTTLTNKLTIRQRGYNEFYETFLSTYVAEADVEAGQLNIVVRVIEGKTNYYVINVGKLAPKEALINELDMVQHYLLGSFLILKDPKVDHFVDCVLSDRLQHYSPQQQ